ncbi:hypothetical protein [Propionibacterium australiense]|nr:hypothetical protein [Propionibacterium australiense]
MQDRLDWRHRGIYITKHGMTPQIADEAYADPASRSGGTVRVIGWSVSIQALVTVIVLPEADVVWGVNAWRSNAMDRHRYGEGDDRWTSRN